MTSFIMNFRKIYVSKHLACFSLLSCLIYRFSLKFFFFLNASDFIDTIVFFFGFGFMFFRTYLNDIFTRNLFDLSVDFFYKI